MEGQEQDLAVGSTEDDVPWGTQECYMRHGAVKVSVYRARKKAKHTVVLLFF